MRGRQRERKRESKLLSVSIMEAVRNISIGPTSWTERETYREKERETERERQRQLFRRVHCVRV